MKDCALNEEDENQLKEFVEDNGAIFISTPFSRAAANRLKDMNVPHIRLAQENAIITPN